VRCDISKLYDKQVHENQTVVGTGVNAAGSLDMEKLGRRL
jgi:hypothetical protein